MIPLQKTAVAAMDVPQGMQHNVPLPGSGKLLDTKQAESDCTSGYR
jgi:hypothetical protein